MIPNYIYNLKKMLIFFFYELLFTYSVCDKLYVIMTMDFYAN